MAQLAKDGKIITIFPSMALAAKETQIFVSNIIYVCQGKENCRQVSIETPGNKMKITIYIPLDEECYQMEEHIIDSQTRERKFTGKRYRRVGNYIPRDTDAFNMFVQELRAKGRVILYSPKDLKPYPYELILGE